MRMNIPADQRKPRRVSLIFFFGKRMYALLLGVRYCDQVRRNGAIVDAKLITDLMP